MRDIFIRLKAIPSKGLVTGQVKFLRGGKYVMAEITSNLLSLKSILKKTLSIIVGYQ